MLFNININGKQGLNVVKLKIILRLFLFERSNAYGR